ncbi:glycosyltransferase family 9 protein [candidate division KSB1 bacterium]|nr:glycosyltransferase family 9 protein [candidate division KSB1 bacterium]
MDTSRIKRFLVIRTDRIGDVILSTPVLTEIKNNFDSSFTAMMLNPYTKDVVSGHPDVDKIIIDDMNGIHKGFSGLKKLAAELKKYRFDAALLLHPTPRLALLCFLAGIPLRVGTGYRYYSFLFNKKIYQHRKTSGRHELDLNLDFVSATGVQPGKIIFKFFIPDEAEQKIDMLLRENNITGQFVVLHPGSGGSALDWPPESFGQLAAQIQNKLKLPVVATGSAAESELIDLIEKQTKNILRLEGQLNIKELAALLKKSSLVVANSTGPLHLAVAVGTDVIGLYCTKTACGPDRWGPYRRTDSVIAPPENAEYEKDNNPMQLITVEQVFQMTRKKLSI